MIAVAGISSSRYSSTSRQAVRWRGFHVDLATLRLMDSAEARRILVHGSSGPEPCGIGIRCVAGVLDLGVVIVVEFWIAVFTRQPGPNDSIVLPGWVYPVILIWWLLYYGTFEYFWKGQTPGKRAARIRVVMGSGGEPTLGAVVRRTITRPIDMLPWVVPYALGVLWMLATGEKRRQRIGDKWAGTKVVYVDPRTPQRDV